MAAASGRFTRGRIGLGAILLGLALHAAAADDALICFGNEPSWRLDLPGGGRARLTLPETRPVDFAGSESRLDFLKERTWRGKPAMGAGGELVAFLRDATCSDGMSDAKHPVTVRVSLPDGRFLAGCCRIAAAGDAPGGARPAALEGVDWSLERLPDQDKSPPASATREVAVRFEGGRVSGFSGCNQFIGTYAIDGDRVTVGPLAGTMMACPEAAMALELALQRALTGTLRYTIDADRLTLTQASGASLLLARSRPRDIESSSWEVTGFNNGRHAVVSPLPGTTLVLTFRGGEIEGFGGCNAFRGSFTRDGDRLAISAPAVARTQCGGKGVMEQELQFLAALRSVATWAVHGSLLDLHRADGSRALTARVRE